MTKGFRLTEIDYVKLSSAVYVYVYGEDNASGAREILSFAVAACPDEEGFRKLIEVYDKTKEFPSYGFLLDRGLVTLPWAEVEALAGRPNRADTRTIIEEARWARQAIDYRNALDTLRDKLQDQEFDDVTGWMSDWITHLSLAARPMREEETAEAIYARRGKQHGGLEFFIQQLDTVTCGVEPGTLCVIGGFAGAGKTTFMLNMAYANAVQHHIDSVFVTMEVPKELIQLWLVARHSLHPKWEEEPPLDRLIMQKAMLTDEQYEHFLRVAADWERSDDYGKVKILQWSDFTSFEAEAFIERIRADAPYQGVFVDYVNKFKSYAIKGIRDQYERINSVVEALATRLALGSNPPIPVVVGAQIGRKYYEAYVESLAAGDDAGYPLSCFSEANALEKESYYALALFTDDHLKESGLMRVQLLKHRGGASIQRPFEVEFLPAHVFVGDDRIGAESNSDDGPGISLGELMS